MLEVIDKENSDLANKIHAGLPSWKIKVENVDGTKVVSIILSEHGTSVFIGPRYALRFGKMLVKAAENAMRAKK